MAEWVTGLLAVRDRNSGKTLEEGQGLRFVWRRMGVCVQPKSTTTDGRWVAL